MRIHLDEVIIHNFLSIGDATLQLANQGYVLVHGSYDQRGCRVL